MTREELIELFTNHIEWDVESNTNYIFNSSMIMDDIIELSLKSVNGAFSAKQMEQAFNDGVESEQQRCGEFDIKNYYK